MVSFSCQICRVDMAIARIRTAEEPPDAAWNLEGANYVGFSTRPWGQEFPDRECHHCTTVDRTPSDPQLLRCGSDPEHSDDGGSRDGLEAANQPPSDVCSLTERLPHGTWYGGKIHYTGDRHSPVLVDFPGDPEPVIPNEHVAAPSCQSLQGINGNVLAVTQMKNCRNVRYVVPKPKDWELDQVDQLFEEQSLFYLSGESNGSNWGAGNYFMPWRSFHPPRHGLHELRTNWEFVEEGCDESDVLCPLAVHSYCLDVYAKASYARLGQVDLDGLWHWREILTQPDSYGIEKHMLPQWPEVERGRKSWDSPWHHWPGDEWLAANPVEIPDLSQALNSCKGCITIQDSTELPDDGLLSLPPKVIEYIISLLGPTEVDAMARTCRTLYTHAQSVFQAFLTSKMTWLWEVSEGNEYPPSRDWPPTWDPLCPPGMGPQETAQPEWRHFRASVEAWIRREPRNSASQSQEGYVNWRRMYWLCSPTTTPLPGLRNRARIWENCQRALACVSTASNLGEIAKRREYLLQKLSDPSQPGWSTNLDASEIP